MTKQKTLTIGKDSAIVKAIGDCWNSLNQMSTEEMDEENEYRYYEAFDAIRLAINELDEAGLVEWQPEQ